MKKKTSRWGKKKGELNCRLSDREPRDGIRNEDVECILLSLLRSFKRHKIGEISSIGISSSSWRVRSERSFVSMTKLFYESCLWARKTSPLLTTQRNTKKRRRNWSRVDLKKPPNAWSKREKIGHYKLGNKNIKQHDILYRCYQFTHKRRRGRDNKPQRKIETKNHRKNKIKRFLRWETC